MPHSIFVVHTQGIRMRYCHYCTNPTTTAFYLPQPIKGWACASCYVEYVVVPATQTTTQTTTQAAPTAPTAQSGLDGATTLEANLGSQSELAQLTNPSYQRTRLGSTTATRQLVGAR